ncbi:unnamed protein product [Paramecium pentaurelia]|uniref:Uncharacterized protein n=1 Tax=Paramecium pentaurelia TaxID=43138 RepID=A0A8S1SST3_9CILI|nr:unnamed protein product [Paramecium pentaurelia]
MMCFSPQEGIQNIDQNFTHQNPEIENQFIPTHQLDQIPLGIIQLQFIYLQMPFVLSQIIGTLKNDCQICAEEYIQEDVECNRIQNPLKITKAQTQYILNQSISIPFYLNCNKLNFQTIQDFFKKRQKQN